MGLELGGGTTRGAGAASDTLGMGGGACLAAAAAAEGDATDAGCWGSGGGGVVARMAARSLRMAALRSKPEAEIRCMPCVWLCGCVCVIVACVTRVNKVVSQVSA